jgi:hypothetical protein
LSSECRSDGEVDGQIEALKAELDAVAIPMKKAIRERGPLIPRSHMRRGPRGEKRPADVIDNAVRHAAIRMKERKYS